MSANLKLGGVWAAAAIAGGLAGSFGGDEADRLTFLSVGQGDCSVLQSQGRVGLIDAGPRTESFDAGQRIVLPRLRAMGIDAVDFVLITHPDEDHSGGLPALARGVPIGRVLVSWVFKDHAGMLQTLREAGCLNRVIWLSPDQHAVIGSLAVRVACPELEAGGEDNDGSPFVRVSASSPAGGSRSAPAAVLTGDAGAETEMRMAQMGDWSAQLLKLGHHGSRTSTSEAWLREVHPSWVVASCGRGNRYGHPHDEVLGRAERRGARIARTDREGDVIFELGPGGWERK